MGRFLSRDIASILYNNPVELNRYGYVANRPIMLADPSGQMALFERVQIELKKINPLTLARISLIGTYLGVLFLKTIFAITAHYLADELDALEDDNPNDLYGTDDSLQQSNPESSSGDDAEDQSDDDDKGFHIAFGRDENLDEFTGQFENTINFREFQNIDWMMTDSNGERRYLGGLDASKIFHATTVAMENWYQIHGDGYYIRFNLWELDRALDEQGEFRIYVQGEDRFDVLTLSELLYIQEHSHLLERTRFYDYNGRRLQEYGDAAGAADRLTRINRVIARYRANLYPRPR